MAMKVMPHEEYLKGIQEKDAVVVCMPTPTPEFPDNLQGNCHDCGRVIYYRPYNEKATVKICIDCASKRMDEGKLDEDANISNRFIKEIKKVMGKKVRKWSRRQRK